MWCDRDDNVQYNPDLKTLLHVTKKNTEFTIGRISHTKNQLSFFHIKNHLY